jgi:hypothetical protein
MQDTPGETPELSTENLLPNESGCEGKLVPSQRKKHPSTDPKGRRKTHRRMGNWEDNLFSRKLVCKLLAIAIVRSTFFIRKSNEGIACRAHSPSERYVLHTPSEKASPTEETSELRTIHSPLPVAVLI